MTQILGDKFVQKWQKVLLTSVTIMTLTTPIASADTLTSPAGVSIEKSVVGRESYSLVMGGFDANDFQVKVEAATSGQDMSVKESSVTAGTQVYSQAVRMIPYTVVVSLTDSGLAKVKAQTGVTNADYIRPIAKLPGFGGSPSSYGSTTGSMTDTVPTVDRIVVVVQKIAQKKKIDDRADLTKAIAQAKADQKAEQKKLNLTEDEQTLWQSAQMMTTAGVDVDPAAAEKNISQTHLPDNKNKQQITADKQAKRKAMLAKIGWRGLGLVILAGFACALGFVAARLRKGKGC